MDSQLGSVNLWNPEINGGLGTVMTDLAFKQKIMLEYLFGFRDTLEEQGYNVNMLFKLETLNNFPHETPPYIKER